MSGKTKYGFVARRYCKRLELEIICSYKIATHLSVFFVCRVGVDSPGVDFESCLVVFFDYAMVDGTVVYVGVDAPLFAPLEVFA